MSIQIPRLLSIADLAQPMETRGPLIDRAMKLSEIYDRWKSFEEGGYSYTVDIHGAKARAPGIHASEIGCERRIVYSLRDEPRQPSHAENARDLMMRRKFSIGHAFHAMMQKEFERVCAWMNAAAGEVVLTFEAEVKIHPSLGAVAEKWGMHSSCDGRFIWWWQGQPYLQVGVEFKTKSGPEYEKLTKPEEDHFEQTCFYQAALDIPLMWTFYYNKSNSNYTKSEPPWFFQFDHTLWSKLESRFGSAVRHAQSGTLPDRNEGFHCTWCPWAHTCGPAIARTFQQQNYMTKNAGAFRKVPVTP